MLWPAHGFELKKLIPMPFWGFANDTTRVSESKRFYAMFGIGANLAMLPSGEFVKYFARIGKKVDPGVDGFGVTLGYLALLVVLAGLAIMGIYWWINKNVLSDTRFYHPTDIKKRKKSPSSPSRRALHIS